MFGHCMTQQHHIDLPMQYSGGSLEAIFRVFATAVLPTRTEATDLHHCYTEMLLTGFLTRAQREKFTNAWSWEHLIYAGRKALDTFNLESLYM